MPSAGWEEEESVTADVVVEARKMQEEYAKDKNILFVSFEREAGDKVLFG